MMKRPDQVKTAPDQGYGERVPPGQFVSKKLPVLTYGPTPKVEMAEWRLEVFGLVENEVQLDWQGFTALPWSALQADFHCVTQWSTLDNLWEGVLFRDVAGLARPKDEARFVMAHCLGGYTANLPLDVVEEGILAHSHNGEPITRDHGWPLRLVVPSRYGWKSAKWLTGIEFMADDRPGFWEERGYNNDGDPWKEERFWPELS